MCPALYRPASASAAGSASAGARGSIGWHARLLLTLTDCVPRRMAGGGSGAASPSPSAVSSGSAPATPTSAGTLLRSRAGGELARGLMWPCAPTPCAHWSALSRGRLVVRKRECQIAIRSYMLAWTYPTGPGSLKRPRDEHDVDSDRGRPHLRVDVSSPTSVLHACARLSRAVIQPPPTVSSSVRFEYLPRWTCCVLGTITAYSPAPRVSRGVPSQLGGLPAPVPAGLFRQASRAGDYRHRLLEEWRHRPVASPVPARCISSLLLRGSCGPPREGWRQV